MMNKTLTSLVISIAGLILTASPVFAHSVVTPKQVGIAATEDFTLTVPTEKDGSTVAVKLMLPNGLNFVTPVVQSGWKVVVKNGPIPSGITPPVAADGDLADSIPTEIDWIGGNIPSEQKEEFVFSAQVPATETELDWKIYQTYSDGSVVSWDLGPNDTQPKDDKGNSDFDSKGPYSKTMVVNDLKPTETISPTNTKSDQNNLPMVISIAALALALFCFLKIQKK